MGIIEISVNRPVLVNLLVILIIIGGVMSYRQMAQDQFPDVSMEMAMVATVMPGASPKEIEQLITIPMEEQIREMTDALETRLNDF